MQSQLFDTIIMSFYGMFPRRPQNRPGKLIWLEICGARFHKIRFLYFMLKCNSS